MLTGKPYQANDKDQGKLEVLLEMNVSLQQIAEKIGVSIPTLQKHYRDVIAASGLRPGPKTFEPTVEQRKQVMTLASWGLPHEGIAAAIELSKGSLQTHYREELRRGRIRASLKVFANLFNMATGPTDRMTTVRAAIWWTKAMMGWRETRRAENTGKDGGPLTTKRQHGTVVILSDNGRSDARVSHPPITDRILLPNKRRSNADEGDPEPDENERRVRTLTKGPAQPQLPTLRGMTA
jgi:hypothetical protein